MGRAVQRSMDAEVAAHGLEFDGAQRDAAVHLDRVGARLLTSSESMGERLRDHWRWLPPPAASTPQRGLYLWGGVGRGKTLLMDWFYESLGFPRRERSHFYRFMRQVHAELRTVTGRARPLETVAQRLAQRARVIAHVSHVVFSPTSCPCVKRRARRSGNAGRPLPHPLPRGNREHQ